jgi:hypothetical protein
MVIVLRLLFRAPVSATIKRTRIFLSLLSVRVQQPHSSARQIYHHSPVTRDALFFCPHNKNPASVQPEFDSCYYLRAGEVDEKIPGRNLSEKEIYGRRYLLISIGHVIM